MVKLGRWKTTCSETLHDRCLSADAMEPQQLPPPLCLLKGRLRKSEDNISGVTKFVEEEKLHYNYLPWTAWWGSPFIRTLRHRETLGYLFFILSIISIVISNTIFHLLGAFWVRHCARYLNASLHLLKRKWALRPLLSPLRNRGSHGEEGRPPLTRWERLEPWHESWSLAPNLVLILWAGSIFFLTGVDASFWRGGLGKKQQQQLSEMRKGENCITSIFPGDPGGVGCGMLLFFKIPCYQHGPQEG